MSRNTFTFADLVGIKGVDGSTIASNANPVPVLASIYRDLDATLSFTTAILSGTDAHTTTWVQVGQDAATYTDTPWLDFLVELGTTQAVTALLEFTNTDDPNTTPPASGDIVRGLSTVLASASLGGLDVSSFGIPTQSKWARLTVTNVAGGGVVKVSAERRDQPPGLAQVPLAVTLSDDFRAGITQAAIRGRQPDGDWVAARADGSADSTATPLDGGASYATPWIDTDGWGAAEVFVAAGVTGTILVEVTDDANAVTPTVRETRTYAFSASDAANGGRLIPFATRLDGIRVTYTNGGTAQSTFLLDVSLRVERIDPRTRIGALVEEEDDATLTKGPIIATDSGGTYAEIHRGGAGVGIDTHLVGAENDVLIDRPPLSSIRTGRAQITSTGATALPPTPLTDRTDLEFTNHSSDLTAWYSEDENKLVGSADGILPLSYRPIPIGPGEQVFFQLDPAAAGSTNALTLDADTVDTNSGTSTPGNLFASDDAYCVFNAEGDFVDISGFDATGSKTLDEIESVTIHLEGKKDSTPASSTAAFAEVQSGTTAGATSVASASLAGGANSLYVVGISRNDLNAVSGVSGGNLAFQSEVTNQANGGRHLDVWWAYGDAVAGAITATMSSSANAHITVIRIVNADPTVTVEDSGATTGTGTAVTGPSLPKTALGIGVTFVSHEAASASPGAGHTGRDDLTVGTGSNTNSLATQTKAFTTAGSEAAPMTLASSTDWVAASIRILPATTNPAITVQPRISGAPTGSTLTATLTSTTDATTSLVITGDRAWTYADLDALVLRLAADTLADIKALADRAWLTAVEASTGSLAVISWTEGRTVEP